MTHVVTDACILCKYTDCVDVCPVDCFHEGPNTLVINPNECPAEAIFAEEDVPENQQVFIALNAELSGKWPTITRSKDPMPEADKWKDVKDKLRHLIK